MKIIITILTIILSITLVSAISFYSGETIEIPLEYEIVNCSVTNSTYDLEGLNLSWHDSNIVISTSLYYKSDVLTISCWVIKGSEVVKISPPVHYSFGGGSSTSSSTSTTQQENKIEEGIEETNKTIEEEIILDEEEKSYSWIWDLVWILISIIVIIILAKKILRKDDKVIQDFNQEEQKGILEGRENEK